MHQNESKHSLNVDAALFLRCLGYGNLCSGTHVHETLQAMRKKEQGLRPAFHLVPKKDASKDWGYHEG